MYQTCVIKKLDKIHREYKHESSKSESSIEFSSEFLRRLDKKPRRLHKIDTTGIVVLTGSSGGGVTS